MLDISGVSKRWRRSGSLTLDSVCLELRAGTTARITGRNGAGKTTLLRIVAGMIVPDRGAVTVEGLDPERDRRAYQQKVGLLSAGSSGLYAQLTVRQHLEYQSHLDLLPKDVAKRAIAREFERLHLPAIDGRRVDRLSMGQRQRLRLAMVMLREPSVLLLDEPANSLDDEGVGIVADVVREVGERGGAVVWCAPAGDLPPFPFDRCLAVEGGRLVSL